MNGAMSIIAGNVTPIVSDILSAEIFFIPTRVGHRMACGMVIGKTRHVNGTHRTVPTRSQPRVSVLVQQAVHKSLSVHSAFRRR